MRHEALTDYLDYLRAAMPEDIAGHYNKARASLLRGPLYFDSNNDETTCFDEDATPHNFSASCEALSAWAEENIQALYEDVLQEDEDDYPVLIADYADIKRAFFGRELTPYL